MTFPSHHSSVSKKGMILLLPRDCSDKGNPLHLQFLELGWPLHCQIRSGIPDQILVLLHGTHPRYSPVGGNLQSSGKSLCWRHHPQCKARSHRAGALRQPWYWKEQGPQMEWLLYVDYATNGHRKAHHLAQASPWLNCLTKGHFHLEQRHFHHLHFEQCHFHP